ncbi:hypothetical protein D3C85_1740560 [compost metagenome]
MPFRLFNNPLPRIHQDDNQLRIRCTGNHVSRVLDMARSISDNVFSMIGLKIFVSDIDGYPLFAFCL